MRSPRVPIKDALAADLGSVRAAGLWRELREIESAQQPSVVLHGREVLLFCSNNYLGLANHPELVAAAQAAAQNFGTSAASSRLISGHMAPHRELEERIAALEALQEQRSTELSNPAIYDDQARYNELLSGYRDDAAKLVELMARWETAQAELGAAE